MLRVGIQPLHPLQQVVLVVDDHVRRVLQDAGVVQNHYHALDLLVSRVNAVHDAFGNHVRTFTLCLLGQVNVLHDTLVRVDGQHQGLFIALECGQHHEGFNEIAFGIVTGSTGLQGQVFLCEDGLAVLIIRTFTQLQFHVLSGIFRIVPFSHRLHSCTDGIVPVIRVGLAVHADFVSASGFTLHIIYIVVVIQAAIAAIVVQFILPSCHIGRSGLVLQVVGIVEVPDVTFVGSHRLVGVILHIVLPQVPTALFVDHRVAVVGTGRVDHQRAGQFGVADHQFRHFQFAHVGLALDGDAHRSQDRNQFGLKVRNAFTCLQLCVTHEALVLLQCLYAGFCRVAELHLVGNVNASLTVAIQANIRISQEVVTFQHVAVGTESRSIIFEGEIRVHIVHQMVFLQPRQLVPLIRVCRHAIADTRVVFVHQQGRNHVTLLKFEATVPRSTRVRISLADVQSYIGDGRSLLPLNRSLGSTVLQEFIIGTSRKYAGQCHRVE